MVSITQYLHKNYYLIALIIIFVVLFLIFITSGTLFTGYHFIDEHMMISTNHDLQNKNFIEELFKATIGEFRGGTEGRFRPFYVFQLYLESKLFGINRFLWSFYTGILIVITTFFLFVFTKLIKFSFKEALFFAFLSVLAFQYFDCITSVITLCQVWFYSQIFSARNARLFIFTCSNV